MSERIAIDLDDLTLGEVEDFEKASGLDVTDLMQGKMPARAMIALVWIAKRRDNPKFTLKDARALKVSDLDFDADPTAAKPESGT